MPLETLSIVAAFSPHVQSHRGVITFCMTSLLTKRSQLAGLIESSPEDFGHILLDEVIALAEDRALSRPEGFVRALADASADTRAAVEQALLTSLRIGLGEAARPVLLNAWSATYRALLEHYGIGLDDAAFADSSQLR